MRTTVLSCQLESVDAWLTTLHLGIIGPQLSLAPSIKFKVFTFVYKANNQCCQCPVHTPLGLTVSVYRAALYYNHFQLSQVFWLPAGLAGSPWELMPWEQVSTNDGPTLLDKKPNSLGPQMEKL